MNGYLYALLALTTKKVGLDKLETENGSGDAGKGLVVGPDGTVITDDLAGYLNLTSEQIEALTDLLE